MNFVLIWIIQGIICGCLACFIAQEKDYGKFSWFCIGLFFGIFGLIAAAGLPDRDFKESNVKHEHELIKERNKEKTYLKEWKCPWCQKMNSKDTFVCAECGYSLK